jgi:hypothetical protein
MKLPTALRWTLIPVAAISGCAATYIAADMIRVIAIRTVAPQRIEALFPADVRAGLAYGAAAVVFVVVGAIVAPKYRLMVSAGLYAVGALVAWQALRGWYFPEGHPRGYQPSQIPLVLTLCGGAIGVLAIAGWSAWHRQQGRGTLHSVPHASGSVQ